MIITLSETRVCLGWLNKFHTIHVPARHQTLFWDIKVNETTSQGSGGSAGTTAFKLIVTWQFHKSCNRFGYRASWGLGRGRHSLHWGGGIQEIFTEEVITESNLRICQAVMATKAFSWSTAKERLRGPTELGTFKYLYHRMRGGKGPAGKEVSTSLERALWWCQGDWSLSKGNGKPLKG